MSTIPDLLELACSARAAFFEGDHVSAFRLFNGFLEGCPALSVDVYARTILIHNYASTAADDQSAIAQAWVIKKLSWVECIILKNRSGQNTSQKRGSLVYGQNPDHKILENGVWYAVDLSMNRDASFYLDTRNLRDWAKTNLVGKTVLNTFAYTGSLGVAALAGGATRVLQLDRNSEFLKFARLSYGLNGLPVASRDFLVQDFFPAVSQLKRGRQTFDCAFIDPPFFAATSKGTVDLETGSTRLINKVRPLINDGGWLVAINNALFVSGREYISSLEALCSDGYLSLEQIIPIPEDFSAYAQTRIGNPPVDPTPFNHSTKIAILRVRRKSMPKEP
jgi:23S rRNA (cytosine1962-C5)-methyltransferase